MGTSQFFACLSLVEEYAIHLCGTVIVLAFVGLHSWHALRHILASETWAEAAQFQSPPAHDPASFALASRFKLTPCSAACMASERCTSGGIRTLNSPL
jgi:hypothetical protein